MIDQLANWNGKDDVILITDTEAGISMKVCPAESLHKILHEYQEFIQTHELVIDVESTDREFLVTTRWANKS